MSTLPDTRESDTARAGGIALRLTTWATARERRNPTGHGKTGTELLWEAAGELGVLLALLDAERARVSQLTEALEALAAECWERMAAATPATWDAPYFIEYPGAQVDAARSVLAVSGGRT